MNLKEFLKSKSYVSPEELYCRILDEESYVRNANAEAIIAQDAESSYMYARDIIKGRFELGEPTIFKSEFATDYQERFDIK